MTEHCPANEDKSMRLLAIGISGSWEATPLPSSHFRVMVMRSQRASAHIPIESALVLIETLSRMFKASEDSFAPPVEIPIVAGLRPVVKSA